MKGINKSTTNILSYQSQHVIRASWRSLFILSFMLSLAFITFTALIFFPGNSSPVLLVSSSILFFLLFFCFSLLLTFVGHYLPLSPLVQFRPLTGGSRLLRLAMTCYSSLILCCIFFLVFYLLSIVVDLCRPPSVVVSPVTV